MMNNQKDLLKTLIDLLDGLVEVFLASVIEPYHVFHAKADRVVQHVLQQFLETHMDTIPKWLFREGAIMYGRIFLSLPMIVLLSWKQYMLATCMVFVVHLASFWGRAVSALASDQCKDGDVGGDGEQLYGEEESFEVVTTGSPHCMPSWAHLHRARIRTNFTTNLVDRAFAIICWVALLHHIPSTGSFHLAQYLTMMTLIVVEAACACLSFDKFLTTHLISPPHTEDAHLSSRRINPFHLEKIKQTFEFTGLALFICPLTRYLGLLMLVLTIPLEYDLLREQTKKRVLYCIETGKSFDHMKLKEWMQMKSLASKLIVGVPRRDAMDMVMNACASNTVDEVVVEAPTKADLLFIEKQGIDYVIIMPGQTSVVTDEVINAGRVLILGEHGHLRRVSPKAAQHKD